MQFQRLPLSIMKSKFSAFFLIVSLCAAGFSHAQSVEALLADESAIRNWQAGKTVSAESVSAFCEKSCFVAKPIPDAVFSLMQGKSFPANATIKRSDLRYLQVLHYDAHGKILIGEVKTNPKKFQEEMLCQKAQVFLNELKLQNYEVELRGLSVEDMLNEKMLEYIDDQELIRLVQERKDEPLVDVDLDRF